jgi:hypothetical protein
MWNIMRDVFIERPTRITSDKFVQGPSVQCFLKISPSFLELGMTWYKYSFGFIIWKSIIINDRRSLGIKYVSFSSQYFSEKLALSYKYCHRLVSKHGAWTCN